MRITWKLLLCTIAAVLISTPAIMADLPDLIPREVLFGNPDKISPQISPDGKFLAYIAPDQDVLNVWVRTIGKKDDRVITKDRDRGIRFYGWAYNNKDLVYIQDKGGDENWRLYAVDMSSRRVRDLTPFEGVRAQNFMMDPNFPNEILIGLNKDNEKLHDVYRINLTSNTCTKEESNPGNVVGWFTDTKFKLRGSLAQMPDGGFQLRVRDHVASEWRPLTTWRSEDALASRPIAFTPDNKSIYATSSIDSNTARLVEISLADGTEKVLASNREVDAGQVVVHPTKYHIQAVAFTKDRTKWEVLDNTVKKDFDAIKKLHDGDFSIANRDLADKTWLVSFETDDGPIYYYSFDRQTRKGQFMFTHRPALQKYKLAKMKPVTIRSRDGLDLHSYLTLPVGVTPKNLPTVLYVHGGPWYRDSWGFNTKAQWLANRGYAVLQVNFRGSTGFGKKFINAGDREWGGKMHDDLIDAVNWIIKKGYADKNKIAIFGRSYGGYATLVGLTFTPDVFACGVDIVGPSNLVTFMNTIPPYWEPMRPFFEKRIGGIDEVQFLKSRSPLFKADRITKPLLIGQGANDPRVKRSESDQIVAAMKSANIPVEYVVYEDEGHGFAKPENRLDFYAKAERFLATHLGGRYEK